MRWVFLLFLHCGLFADTVYITGVDSANQPIYWTSALPNPPSGPNLLDTGLDPGGAAFKVTFAPTKTAYLVGQVANVDFTGAVDWTVPPGGTSSLVNAIDVQSDIYYVSANGIAFNPSGIGFIVGTNSSGNASYWTVAASGTVTGPIDLDLGGFANAVAFTNTGTGYITGVDGLGNASYWAISPAGAVTGPFLLVGGEAGGGGNALAAAVSPSGTAYLVGTTTGGEACFWTISPSGTASSANVLDGGINCMARGVAFLPSGAGIIVGQGAGNVSCYWSLSSDGSASLLNPLPNGAGGGSSAYGVAYSSDQTAYIVGLDGSNNGVYWTLPLSGSPIGYSILNGGAFALAYSIAIDFPMPPTNFQGGFVINDFGLIFEYSANLTWDPSPSSGVIGYNIYMNGVKIATVSGSTTQYKISDQIRGSAIYTVTAVDILGNESVPAIVTPN